jgi:hypothetical protein
MAACAITALVIEVMLLPYTLIVLALLGLGILGLAKLGVAAALASGVRARWHGWRALPFAAIGAEIFAAPLPIQSYEWSWIDGRLQVLKSEDAAVVETALRTLNDYRLIFRRFAIPACWSLVTTPILASRMKLNACSAQTRPIATPAICTAKRPGK